MPTDLTTMKARIARELGNRTDLTTEIGEAISDAIAIYQNDRFYFNESRNITFPTVASQEFYTVTDNANIPDLLATDYVMKIVGTNVIRLSYELPDVIEDVANTSTFTGEPYSYTYYQQKIRLFPIPNSVITIRIGAHIKLAAPTSDTDATSPWLIESCAERLIRSRAKYQIATQKTLNAAMAAAMSPDDGECYRAFQELKGRTNRQTGTGIIAASSF